MLCSPHVRCACNNAKRPRFGHVGPVRVYVPVSVLVVFPSFYSTCIVLTCPVALLVLYITLQSLYFEYHHISLLFSNSLVLYLCVNAELVHRTRADSS